MMRRVDELGTPADWLVRAQHDRCLPEIEGVRLWASTTSTEPLGEITFVSGAREGQKSRTVRQTVGPRGRDCGWQTGQDQGSLRDRA